MVQLERRDRTNCGDSPNTNAVSRRGALSLIGTSGIGLFGANSVASEDVAPRAPDRETTAMSYNIAHGVGEDGKLDLERTADVIRDSGAKIAALQEVDVHWGERSNFEDQAKTLAKLLDMNYFFGHIYSHDPPESGQPRREYGLAVLSEYPILDSMNHELTRLSTQEDAVPEPMPGFPEVVVNVRGVHVSVFSTHLDYRGDPTVRELQVADTLEITNEIDRPTLLIGDLNARPDAPELAPLWEEFVDSWDAANDDPGYTFPAADPDRRIDYILTSPEIETDAARVEETLASDHRPVIADLSLPGPAVSDSESP